MALLCFDLIRWTPEKWPSTALLFKVRALLGQCRSLFVSWSRIRKLVVLLLSDRPRSCQILSRLLSVCPELASTKLRVSQPVYFLSGSKPVPLGGCWLTRSESWRPLEPFSSWGADWILDRRSSWNGCKMSIPEVLKSKMGEGSSGEVPWNCLGVSLTLLCSPWLHASASSWNQQSESCHSCLACTPCCPVEFLITQIRIVHGLDDLDKSYFWGFLPFRRWGTSPST